MDKKSFFRGFGVGVLFAAVILGISFTVRTSDSYIKTRAKELGMVYASQESDKVISEDSATPSPDSSSTEESDEKKEEQKDNQDDKTSVMTEPEVTKSPEPTSKPKTTKEEKATSSPKIDMKEEKGKMEKDIRNEEKSLTIVAGEWSSDVSKKLQSMGIVSSAAKFDKYLEDHGYSNLINAGTYRVSKGDTYDELAKKITGNK